MARRTFNADSRPGVCATSPDFRSIGSVVAMVMLAVNGCISDAPAKVQAIELGAPSRILGDSSSLGLPTAMGVVGDYVVVVDALSDEAIHVIDGRTGHVVNRIAPRGDGPGEVRSPWTLFRDASDPTRVWTFDLIRRHFTLWDILAPPNAAAVRRINYTGPLAPASRPIYTRSGTLTIDLHSGHTAALYDSAGSSVVAKAGAPPFDSSAYRGHALADNSFALADVNDYFPVLHPTQERMALLYRRATRMDVITVAEHLLVDKGPADTLAPPTLGQGQAEFEAHANGQSATERFVYSVFCGCDPRGRRASDRGHVIRVYDWNGNRVADYRLDRYVSTIAVSPNDSILYGAVEDPVPLIGEWILPRAHLNARRD